MVLTEHKKTKHALDSFFFFFSFLENQHVLDFENTKKLFKKNIYIFIETNFGQKTKIVI